MKKLFLLCTIAFSINSIAQNVGIGTTTPQTTLDVKGNIRTGGINNFILYDSLAGRITWTNSNLWVTGPQYLMKHSASAEGLYSNGAQLEYRNQSGNPIFFTNWNDGNGYFSGKLGIGTVNPTAKLQVSDGASGIPPFFSARMVVETNSHTYLNLLSPDPFETGILFGSGTNAASGVISYNSSGISKGFLFSTNGNQQRMVINSAGNVGIGTTNPQKNLSVQNGMNIDQADGNSGTTANTITFGNGSGEGVGSKRNPGGNQWGLDFYTNSIIRMSISNGGNVGIGTTNPQYPLDINGRMRLNGTSSNDAGMWLNDAGVDRAFVGLENNNYIGFYGNEGAGWKFGMNTQTGALKINGSEGSNGKVLASTGGSANNWVSPTNTLFNNSASINNTTSITLSQTSGWTTLPGMTYTFSSAGNSKVLISSFTGFHTIACSFCGTTSVNVTAYIDGALFMTGLAYHIANDVYFTASFSIMPTLTGGTHTIEIKALNNGGPNVSFDQKNLIILIIPE